MFLGFVSTFLSVHRAFLAETVVTYTTTLEAFYTLIPIIGGSLTSRFTFRARGFASGSSLVFACLDVVRSTGSGFPAAFGCPFTSAMSILPVRIGISAQYRS